MANQITVDIVADTRNLVQGVKTTNDQLSSLNQSVGKLKSAFGGLAAAFGFQVGIGYLKAAIAGAAEEEATFAKVAALYGADGKRITDSINNLAKGLSVDDGAIAQYFLDLAAATDGRFKPFYEDIVTQSVRLGTVLGQPPEQFISAWTKALKDGKITANEVAKLGIDLSAEQKKTFDGLKTTAERIQFLLDVAAEQSKDAEKFVTPWQKLQFQLAELKDTIGAALLPALSLMLKAFESLSPTGQKIVGTIAAIVVGLSALATVVAPIVFVFAELGITWLKVKTAIMAVVTAMRALALATVTNPFAVVVLGIVALIAVTVLLVKNWDTVVATFKKGVEAIKNAFNAVREWFAGLGNQIKNAAGNLLEVGKRFGSDIMNGLVQGIRNLASAPINAIKGVVSGLTGAVKGFLKIGSPSKVFAGFGENIVEGLAIGIDKAQSLADGAMANLSTGLTLAPSLSGAASRSGVNININAGLGTDPYELGRAVRAALNKYDGVNGR